MLPQTNIGSGARDYMPGLKAGGGGSVSGAASQTTEGADLSVLRQQYRDFIDAKQAELIERREACHYYHGDQWTRAELVVLKARRQPPVTKNRVNRKIDGIVGLLVRTRQDPKAYPRNPDHVQGADIATAALNYALDREFWEFKSAEVGRECARDGIGGIELTLEPTREGDHNVGLNLVDSECYFYDHRSFEPDFSDARWQGTAKWVDLEVAQEEFPDRADDLANAIERGGDMTNPWDDRGAQWVDTTRQRLRLIDHWFVQNKQWNFCIYAADVKIMEGPSPFTDDEDRRISKYLMFSCAVDHDGDRYGFVRQMKSPQDEVNHRSSKALHALNTRQIKYEKNALADVEVTRREVARKDGTIEIQEGYWDKFEILTGEAQADFQGQHVMLQEAINEIENFGPNPALLGAGVENKSGRAIGLLQQAGMAELGPYLESYRQWKLRTYRAVFWAIQTFWKVQRYIRITDDEDAINFLKINGLGMDQFGRPALVNAIGELDVDIVLDEGPDTLTSTDEAYQMLKDDPAIPPDIKIELMTGLRADVKKRVLDRLRQPPPPDPMKDQAKQLALEQATASIGKDKTASLLNVAKAGQALGSVLPPIDALPGITNPGAEAGAGIPPVPPVAGVPGVPQGIPPALAPRPPAPITMQPPMATPLNGPA